MDSRKLIVFYIILFVMISSALVLSYDIPPVIKYSGDINSDGVVDSEDLSVFSGQWLQSPCDPNADIVPNGGDGFVNFLDYAALAKDWLGDSAMSAAKVGVECAKYVASKTSDGGYNNNTPFKTGSNSLSDSDCDTMWDRLCNGLQTEQLGGLTVPPAAVFADMMGSGVQIVTPDIPCGDNSTFRICFYRYDSNKFLIQMDCVGTYGSSYQMASCSFNLLKDQAVLQYAVAGRGRIWLTGDTTIHGSIYSSWNRTDISPFNLTADSAVTGTFNTILTRQEIEDANDYRLDSTDQLLGTYEGVNYGVLDSSNISGMKITDYNTEMYKVMANYAQTATVSGSLISNGKIPTSGYPTVTEYYPHMADRYSQPVSGSRTLSRRKYENITLRNVVVSGGTNPLFKNCTFEEVLYVDCSASGTGTSSTNYNNIRFENCTFNGLIVTNTPAVLTNGWWQKNCLYFTGAATFRNNSSIPEATILASHFNVNLGNTNPAQSDSNVLTGVIVGGIVDVCGYARIHGTVISMADTSSYSSGYVTNIGVAYDDHESDNGDAGTIEIIPDPGKMLPSGIMTPVILVPVGQ